jgi:hypothetical protein
MRLLNVQVFQALAKCPVNSETTQTPVAPKCTSSALTQMHICLRFLVDIVNMSVLHIETQLLVTAHLIRACAKIHPTPIFLIGSS